MALRVNPTYRQRRFGEEVRRLRERAGLSSTEAAGLLGMKQPQLSNVEAGKTGLTTDRLQRLAELAGVRNNPLIEALNDMGRDPGKGWWSEYRGALPQVHLDFAELEAGAARLINYEPMFVPGLLQTHEYATAAHRGGYGGGTAEEREAVVHFRMRRQEVLNGEQPPRFHAIIHEAALHASFGDAKVMRGQLLRLIEVSRLPNVTIQVLPFDGPVAFGSSFMLVEPGVPELSTVIVPHVEQSLYLGDAGAVARYNEWFASLKGVALPAVDAAVPPERHAVKDSLGLIQRLLYPLL